MAFPIFGGENKTNNWIHIPEKSPPWRKFPISEAPGRAAPPLPEKDVTRATTFDCDADVKLTVSAAIALRRPLLVTGSPGTGKSTLAYAIAYDLGLGAVLRWNITSRSTLKDGLYSYDALDRLNAASLSESVPKVGDYIKLGPLGTALLPTMRPRVLLIDELDKSDIDLPNDLLHIFEEGVYEIPELLRASEPESQVLPYDPTGPDDKIKIGHGRVMCSAFPIVVLTTNNEREFSGPFLRRCVQLRFDDPEWDELVDIARRHLNAAAPSDLLTAELETVKKDWNDKRSVGYVTTDQVMNALYILTMGGLDQHQREALRAKLTDALLKPVTRSTNSG